MTLGGQNIGEKLPTDRPREFRCKKCRARCTQSTDGTLEYGHMTGCPDRPAEWPAGGQYLKHADHAPGADERELVTDGGLTVTPFVRASQLYDVRAGELLHFDWGKLQTLSESQAEVERAVAAIEEGR